LVLSCGEDGSEPIAPSIPPGYTYPIASYREAGRITGTGAKAAIGDALPGQIEGVVKDLIDGAFRAEGCTRPAFQSIVAAGANAVVLHYSGSDSALRVGDLVLIDIGATSNDICSDCSRTFPAGSAYDPRQRELYQLVLEVHEQVVRSARPGLDTLTTLTRRARELFRASPLRARDQNGDLQPMDSFFTHSIGHYVGKSVHGEDTGWRASEPLEVGQVLTIEPGLYIAAEGVGIRIEDTYLVTGTGLECLTCGCPKDPAEVEALRASLASAVSAVTCETSERHAPGPWRPPPPDPSVVRSSRARPGGAWMPPRSPRRPRGMRLRWPSTAC